MCTLCSLLAHIAHSQCLVFNLRFLLHQLHFSFHFFFLSFALSSFGPFLCWEYFVIPPLYVHLYIFGFHAIFFISFSFTNKIFYGIRQSNSAKIKHFRLSDFQTFRKLKRQIMSMFIAICRTILLCGSHLLFSIKWNSLCNRLSHRIIYIKLSAACSFAVAPLHARSR